MGTALIHANKRTDRRTDGQTDGQPDRQTGCNDEASKSLSRQCECVEKSPSSVTLFFFLSETTKLVLLKSGFGSCATSTGGCFICMRED